MQIILIFILQINLILISSSGVLYIKQRFIYTKLNTTVSLKMVVLILCRDETLLCSTLLSKNIKIKIYRITILPVVLYGCETWSLTLRKERRLRVFEKRVLVCKDCWFESRRKHGCLSLVSVMCCQLEVFASG